MPEFVIFGYGGNKKPMDSGMRIGTAIDESFARDIVDAMARKYIGQWFGYSEHKFKATVRSKPIRYGTIEAE